MIYIALLGHFLKHSSQTDFNILSLFFLFFFFLNLFGNHFLG